MEEIKELLEQINRKLDMIAGLSCIGEILSQKQISPTDVAKMYEVSRTAIYSTHRYLLPNYGLKDPDEKGHLKYSMQEVLDWNKIPVEKRKREWDDIASLKNMSW